MNHVAVECGLKDIHVTVECVVTGSNDSHDCCSLSWFAASSLLSKNREYHCYSTCMFLCSVHFNSFFGFRVHCMFVSIVFTSSQALPE